MTDQKWIHWSGLALLVTSVLRIASWAFYAPGPDSALQGSWVAVHIGLLISGLLLLFGLLGIYARQVEQVGIPGMLGFALAFIGTAIFVGFIILEALLPAPVVTPSDLADPALLFGNPNAVVYLLYSLIQSIGLILLGVPTMRAGVLPRWAALLAIIGVVPAAFGLLLPAAVAWIGRLILNAGLAWLGYALWMDTGEN
jgi:hypothetical protein